MTPEEFGDETLPDAEPTTPRPDLAGLLVSASGLLVAAFGSVLLVTPVGDNQAAGAPDFGALESIGIIAVGLVLIAASMWRRARSPIGLPAAVIGLLVSVACLAIVGASWLAIVPTFALLALVWRPFPLPPSSRS